jgi:hypothetical protein
VGEALLRFGIMTKWMRGCAHYVLGPFGRDSDLRRHGEKVASRGGKNAKKWSVVAVARKLAVLLHRLWVTGVGYGLAWTRRLSGIRPGLWLC